MAGAPRIGSVPAPLWQGLTRLLAGVSCPPYRQTEPHWGCFFYGKPTLMGVLDATLHLCTAPSRRVSGPAAHVTHSLGHDSEGTSSVSHRFSCRSPGATPHLCLCWL